VRISPITGELISDEVENAYRLYVWDVSVRVLRVLAIAGSVFYLAGFTIDFQLVGREPELHWLLTIRVAVAMMLAAVALYVSPRRPRPRQTDLIVTLTQLAVAVATCLIIALSPGGIIFHALTVIVILLLFYLFAPNRLVLTAASAVFLSVLFPVVAVIRLEPLSEELTLVGLFLLLVNTFGCLNGREVRRARRERFLMFDDERRARHELDNEMARRAEAEAALSASESRYRELVESSPYAILVHRDGKVLYANTAACRLVGVNMPADLEGADIFDFLTSESGGTVRERIQQMVTSHELSPPIELKIHTADGRSLDLEVGSSVTTFADGPAIQSVGIDITEGKRMRAELERLATVDMLTGAFNRHSFFTQGEAEIRRARRHGRELAAIMFDIDYFKQVNDTHGHAVGDAVLTALGRACRAALRSEDLLGRIGGEEFAVLLPEIDGVAALAAAERLRDRIGAMRVPAGSQSVHITISVGLAALETEDLGLDDLLRRADDALYGAKRGGRDRSVRR